MRHGTMLTAALGLALLAPTADATDTGLVVLRGTWKLRAHKHGLSMRASGPLKLRINPTAGTFTCFCRGKATVRGETRIEGRKVGVSGTSTATATRCSGTFKGGQIKGTMRFMQRTNAKYTVKVKGKVVSKRMRQSKPFPAVIRGSVSLSSGGSGTIVDDDREVWSWTVAGAGETAPEVTPPPGEGKRPPDHALPPPKARKLGEGKTPEEHKRDLARQREREAHQARQKRVKERAAKRDKQRKEREAARLGDKLKGKPKPEQQRLVKEHVDKSKKETDQDVAKQDAKLREAKEKTAFNKALDKDANQLGDDVKGALDKGKQAIVDKVTDKGWQWAKGKSKTAKKAEGAWKKLENSKLGKAAKAAGKLKEKIDKAKEVVDEVRQVKKSIDRINNKVKDGQISKDRGKVLKGGTILGKALSKVVSWIPVFGKTASKVTDKSFGAAMKAGEKIATHYTKTDCCINDPLADCCL